MSVRRYDFGRDPDISRTRGRRARRPSDRTHCPNDHPYSPENTRLNSKGHRVCIPCVREAGKRYRETQSVLLTCATCGDQFKMSKRRARTGAECPLCRRGCPVVAIEPTDELRQYWLDKFSLELDGDRLVGELSSIVALRRLAAITFIPLNDEFTTGATRTDLDGSSAGGPEGRLAA